MNKFVARMLELGAELDKAVSPIEISMVINDAEILYKNHIEQLTIPRVVVPKGTLCECKKHSLKTNYGFEVCTKCGNEFND